MKFFIDYGVGEPQCCEKNEVGEVMEVADQGATLTHESIVIRNEKGKILARRNWYETLDNIRNQGSPLKIGDGYYGDWQMPMFIVMDMD